MKKVLLKVVVFVVAVLSPLNADINPYVYDSKSLIGIEAGYSAFDVENNATTPLRGSEKFGFTGIKIGAETTNYRIFLSARVNLISGYDYAYMYGIEGQYLINFSDFMNAFIGVNGGYANIRFEDNTNATREVASSYIGGDLGFNFHLGENVDFEIGARASTLSDATHLLNGVEYKFDNIIDGYASLIFKYSMD